MSCLFYSLIRSQYVRGAYSNADALRRALVEYVRVNESVFSEHVRAASDCTAETVAQYCSRMSHTTTMGDFTMVCAASLLFNVNIVVHFRRSDGSECLYEIVDDQQQQRQRRASLHLSWVPSHWEFVGDH